MESRCIGALSGCKGAGKEPGQAGSWDDEGWRRRVCEDEVKSLVACLLTSFPSFAPPPPRPSQACCPPAERGLNNLCLCHSPPRAALRTAGT